MLARERGFKGDNPPFKNVIVIIKEMTETTIQVKRARTDREPGLYKIMMEKIRDHHRYFCPIESVTEISLATITKKEMKNCKECEFRNPIKQTYVKVTKRIVGNQTLDERIKTHKAVFPHSTVEKVEDYYEHIVEGLLKLKEAKIVHFNIQPSNIMYSATECLPVITEFGEAFVLDDLYNDETMVEVFTKPHPHNRCMEAVLISAILDTVEWKTKPINIVSLKRVISKKMMDNEVLAKKWEIYMEKHAGADGKIVVDDLLKNWYTWDLYSVNKIFHKTNIQATNPGEPYIKIANV